MWAKNAMRTRSVSRYSAQVSFCHLSVDIRTIHPAIYQWPYELFDITPLGCGILHDNRIVCDVSTNQTGTTYHPCSHDLNRPWWRHLIGIELGNFEHKAAVLPTWPPGWFPLSHPGYVGWAHWTLKPLTLPWVCTADCKVKAEDVPNFRIRPIFAPVFSKIRFNQVYLPEIIVIRGYHHPFTFELYITDDTNIVDMHTCEEGVKLVYCFRILWQ